MPSEVSIAAEPRTEFGKGAARRIRRADKVPAVLYGHGTDPIHVTLPGHELMLALKTANALLSIDVDGTSQLALPKQVQRHPIKGVIEHADLLLVRRGERVTVDVQVVLVGQAVPDALVTVETTTLSVQAEATHIPESIEVSVEGLPIGTQIHVRDLTPPEGCSFAIDEGALVVHVAAQQTAAALEAELAEAEAGMGGERTEVAAPAETPEEPAATSSDA